MKTHKTLLLAAMLLVAFSWQTYAQSSKTELADQKFHRMNYISASRHYVKLVKRGHKTPYIYMRLALSYYNLRNMAKAAHYFQKYLDSDPNQIDPLTYFRYAQALKTGGNFEKSNEYMRKFASAAPDDPRAEAFRKNPNYIHDLLNQKAMFTGKKLTLNTKYNDFGGYIKDSKLYFASGRNESRRNYDRTGQPSLDIYVVVKKNGQYQEPELLDGDVNTKYNEAGVAITQDGKTMYFSRITYFDHNYKENKKGVNQLQIYKATKVNDEWTDIQKLPFDSVAFSSAQPALSPNGKFLYFASNRPSTYGKSDIYKVRINDDGTYGKPIHLGRNINTPGKDNFPFISPKGNLYFSSNGHLGLGGLDVFMAKKQGSGFGKVVAMAPPVNSTASDFAFSYYPNTKVGFVSSDRGFGGVSEGDNNIMPTSNIYKLHRIKKKTLLVKAKIIDAKSGKVIAKAKVHLYRNSKVVEKAQTNKQGKAVFSKHPAGTNYMLEINAKGYNSNAVTVDKKKGTVMVNVKMVPKPKPKPVYIKTKPILFAFDKANITPEAATELNKIVRMMKKNPDLKIQINSYTDRRGSEAYNMQLSKRRAKSTKQYIVSQGINADRLTTKAHGESNPRVECTTCTPKQFHKNRRSQFKVIQK